MIAKNDRVRVGDREGRVRRLWTYVHTEEIEVEVEFDDDGPDQILSGSEIEKIEI